MRSLSEITGLTRCETSLGNGAYTDTEAGCALEDSEKSLAQSSTAVPKGGV